MTFVPLDSTAGADDGQVHGLTSSVRVVAVPGLRLVVAAAPTGRCNVDTRAHDTVRKLLVANGERWLRVLVEVHKVLTPRAEFE